jgi:hypothetical protein
VHALAEYRTWENQYGAIFTDWLAACGETGTETTTGPFTSSGSARRAELCKDCWPQGHATPHAKPRKVEAT